MRLLLTKRLLQYSSLILIFSIFSALGLPRHSNSDIQRRAAVCNGHAELCERSFGSVSFVGAHDSYAIGNSQSQRKFEVFKLGILFSGLMGRLSVSLLSS